MQGILGSGWLNEYVFVVNCDAEIFFFCFLFLGFNLFMLLVLLREFIN